ncbi:hypothetical protein PILCRDRAFT_814454 [Piloderma croceum F 1598]|uniref:RBR-type E3 ubiquitin transferase n=1 Tax=Piloderma croceum (strain F 1598) TaxID=765440 RepID=A0A0C3GAS9_PILCF|nr:hypothetical protein PILCRDRAFT_814454 [Piloderma croceum F 1598]
MQYSNLDPNEKGKGKDRPFTTTDDLLLSVDGPTGSTSSGPDDFTGKGLAHVYPICGICGDAFQNTHSPLSASLSANSSTRLPFGLHLPCPPQHTYCVNCLSLYIISKLDPDGTGGAPDEQKIFPIRCPECPLDQWTVGIQDDVAERILTRDRITLWHHRKLLDSLPRYYCPNRQCSTLVLLHEDPGEPQATCPLCTTVMCVPCKTQWHTDLTCEEYQALPLDERSPEDQLLIQLAKEKKWRRCDCGIMIDLAFGCNHMTCHCGRHFCFKCGAAWDMEAYKCSRGAGCELWEDDDMLLEEDQRQGGVDAQQPLAQEAIAPPHIFHVPGVAPLRHQEQRVIRDFDWIEDEGVVVSKHSFTFGMIQRINCGYCGSTFVSLAGLRHHLANIRRHPIYSCCGKFFRLREHYLQHQSASWPHHHTCVRGDDEV